MLYGIAFLACVERAGILIAADTGTYASVASLTAPSRGAQESGYFMRLPKTFLLEDAAVTVMIGLAGVSMRTTARRTRSGPVLVGGSGVDHLGVTPSLKLLDAGDIVGLLPLGEPTRLTKLTGNCEAAARLTLRSGWERWMRSNFH